MNPCIHRGKSKKIAKAQADRAHLVEPVSVLFRERGQEGVARPISWRLQVWIRWISCGCMSRANGDSRSTGCALAALGGDATRQLEAVRTSF